LVSRNGIKELMEKKFDLGACAREWRGGAPPPVVATPTAPAAVSSTASVPGPSSPCPSPPSPGLNWTPKVTPPEHAKATAALERIEGEPWEVQEKFYSTTMKVLSNILTTPDEAKFRSIKRTVKIFEFAENAALDCLSAVGFTVNPDNVVFNGDLGHLHWLHSETQANANLSFERKQRRDRDERIKEELEKDKGRIEARTMGGDDKGRNQYGADRRRRGGGGG